MTFNATRIQSGKKIIRETQRINNKKTIAVIITDFQSFAVNTFGKSAGATSAVSITCGASPPLGVYDEVQRAFIPSLSAARASICELIREIPSLLNGGVRISIRSIPLSIEF